MSTEIVALSEIEETANRVIAKLRRELDASTKRFGAELIAAGPSWRGELEAVLNDAETGTIRRLRDVLNASDTGTLAILDRNLEGRIGELGSRLDGSIGTLVEKLRVEIVEFDRLLAERASAFDRTSDERLDRMVTALRNRVDDIDDRLTGRIADADARLDARLREADARAEARVDQLGGVLSSRIEQLGNDVVDPAMLDIRRSLSEARRQFVRGALLLFVFGGFLSLILTHGATSDAGQKAEWTRIGLFSVFCVLAFVVLFSNRVIDGLMGEPRRSRS